MSTAPALDRVLAEGLGLLIDVESSEETESCTELKAINTMAV